MGIVRIRADGLCTSMHQRPGDEAHQWSRVLFGAQPSRSALNPSCQFQVRTFVLLRVWTSVVDCAHGTGSILYLLRSDWSLRWFDVCICTDASEKCFPFAVRAGCRELASEVGRASERTKFKRSSRSVCAGSRALRSIAPDVDLECSRSEEDEVSLAQRESRADFPEVSLQLLGPFCVGIGGLRWFLS